MLYWWKQKRIQLKMLFLYYIRIEMNALVKRQKNLLEQKRSGSKLAVERMPHYPWCWQNRIPEKISKKNNHFLVLSVCDFILVSPFTSLSLYRSQKVVSKEGQAALMLLCNCFHTFSISPSKAESRDDLPAPTVPTTAMRAPSLTDMLMSFKVGLLALSHLDLGFNKHIY